MGWTRSSVRNFALAITIVALAACGGDDAVTPPDMCAGVVCSAIDGCHGAGTCDPSTGACSTPILDDGAACDDGHATTPLDTCQAGSCVGLPFSPTQGWGPPGTPLPPWAEVVSPAELAALAGEDGFAPVTAGEREAAIAATQQQVDDAMALVNVRMAGDPRLARWFPPAGTPLPPYLQPAPGGYRMQVGNETIQLDGESQKAVDLAYSLTRTTARDNLEARYRVLYPVLPGDEQVGLPEPGALATVDDPTLTGLVDELARRVDRSVPGRDQLPEAGDPFGGTGCVPASGSLSDWMASGWDDYTGWQLLDAETAMRSQGHRGSCSAHAIVAGIELILKHDRGVDTNLSEQQLYADAKGLWFPVPLDYKDGIGLSSTLDEMIDRDYDLGTETRWGYNRSLARVDDELQHRYTHSCDGYTQTCTDTNHQMRMVCSMVGPQTFCGWSKPPATPSKARVRQVVSLWNPLEPESSLAAIRAMLQAGHPVVLGLTTTDSFRAAADEPNLSELEERGFVRWPWPDEGEATPGKHAVLVVGNVWNAQLPELFQRDAATYGAGYLVAKNSWGCSGDVGHLYLGYAYLIENVDTAVALVDVESNLAAPQVGLAIARSRLDAAGTARLTLTSNHATRVVRLYEGLTIAAPLRELTIPDPADGRITRFDLPFTAAANGLHLYRAVAEDEFGNRVTSNLVALLVTIDNVAPEVTLTAAPATVFSPGAVTLTAAATDTSGIAKVQFLRGLSVIAQDTTAPYAVSVPLGAGDLGANNFVAIAYDGAGNQRASNIVPVTVVGGGVRPIIGHFTAAPQGLPHGGGTTTLDWQVLGASTVRIEPGLGLVAASGSAMVPVATSTTFTLTATNAAGASTADVAVVVAPPPPDVTPPTVSMTASSTHLVVPATLRFDVTASDDRGVTAVELRRDGALVATDVTPGDGFAFQLALGAADVGTAAWTARARDAAGNAATSAPITVVVDPAPPGVPVIDALVAMPPMLPAAGGTTTLSWSVTGPVTSLTIDHGVGDVTGLGSRMVAVAATTVFTLTATNATGAAQRQVTVTVLPDTTAPTNVTLTPSAAMVTAPATVTFAATATDDVGVVAVDFLRDGVVIATDATAGNGFTAAVDLGLADVGSAAWTARARDAAGNAGTSAPVTITVFDAARYVSPTGDDASPACAQASPCRTIAHAAALAGVDGTVVLLDGTFDTSTQGTGDIVLAQRVTVRAQHDRQAIVKNLLVFSAGGAALGLRVDRTAPGAQNRAGLAVTGGVMAIESVDWKGLFTGPNISEGLKVSGTAVVTVRPGLVADYTALTVDNPGVSSAQPFLHVLDDAQVTIEGGTFGGPGLGSLPTTVSNGAGAGVLLRNRARLTLRGVTLVFDTTGVALLESSRLTLEQGSVLVAGAGSAGIGGAIQLERNVAGEIPRAFITDSIIDGTTDALHAAACVFSSETGTVGELTLVRSTLRRCGAGLRVLVGTGLVVTAADSHLRTNVWTGAECQGVCELDFTGGSIADNALGATGQRGGVWMGQTNVAYRLKLRGVQVTNNRSTTNVIDHSGLYLRGNASSVYDLGTTASPGGNTFRDNSTGTQSANVGLNTASGVQVSAVGNTWNPGIQGADGAGGLAIGTVAAGSGANFRIIAGSLVTSN